MELVSLVSLQHLAKSSGLKHIIEGDTCPSKFELSPTLNDLQYVGARQTAFRHQVPYQMITGSIAEKPKIDEPGIPMAVQGIIELLQSCLIFLPKLDSISENSRVESFIPSILCYILMSS